MCVLKCVEGEVPRLNPLHWQLRWARASSDKPSGVSPKGSQSHLPCLPVSVTEITWPSVIKMPLSNTHKHIG